MVHLCCCTCASFIACLTCMCITRQHTLTYRHPLSACGITGTTYMLAIPITPVGITTTAIPLHDVTLRAPIYQNAHTHA